MEKYYIAERNCLCALCREIIEKNNEFKKIQVNEFDNKKSLIVVLLYHKDCYKKIKQGFSDYNNLRSIRE